MPQELYLVDGSGFIFRAYHALPPLTTRHGIPTGAVYGFANMLLKLEAEYRPSHLAVVFDAGGRSFRDDLYPEYKANREEPPEDLRPQFGLVREVVDAFDVRRIEATDAEADDVIATLALRARQAGLRVVIVSSDKDLMQLVEEPYVVMLDTMKDPPRLYDTAGVVEKFGVPPAQVGEVLALMGDSVDNVPGVRGIGPKGAAALISHFGSVEALYQRLDEVATVPGLRGAKSLEAKLRASEAEARLSRRLVELDRQTPCPVELESLVRHTPDFDAVERELTRLEFTRLIGRARALLGAKGGASQTVRSGGQLAGEPAGATPSPPSTSPQGSLFVSEAPPQAQAPSEGTGPSNGALGLVSDVRAAPEPTVLSTAEALRTLVTQLVSEAPLGVVFEATSSSGLTASLVGVALASSARSAYVPVGHRYLGVPPQLPCAEALALLQPLLDEAALHVPDAKEAMILVERHGARLGAVRSDPLLCSYLLDPSETHTLPSAAGRQLGWTLEPREALVGTGKRQLHFDTLEIDRVARFAEARARASLALGEQGRSALEARGQLSLLDDVELPLSRVLATMEQRGICLEVPALRALSGEVAESLRAIEAEVQAEAVRVGGERYAELNLGSPKQLQELLFETLHLTPQRRTKTGYSVDAETLEELSAESPLVARIAEHRQLQKLKGTYLDALPALVHPRDGRLHTSYLQTATATGRLSSVDPNLQNVPIRSELGLRIREAFVASPGMQLVVGDYSQIELRVLAHLAEDPVLIDAFGRGEDVHERTVAEMFGEERRHDGELRRVAKMINYGIVYGLSDFGLAQRLGIGRTEAHAFIERYLATYARVARYLDELVQEAYRQGGSRTILGRFRPLPELGQKSRTVRMAGERMAKNTPIQGSAADLLKLAMISVEERLAREHPAARMLLTVHDELVLESPTAEAEAVGRTMKAAMEGIWQLRVPLVVDVGVGPNWATAK